MLLLNFVESQKKALLESESWTPVCLPRFNDRGFLHAYVAYVDGASGLCLALLAGDNAPETFETFRGARRAIESALRRDGVLAAAARAAAQPADARLADLLPADCLHCAVACRETGAEPPGAYLEDPGPRPPKQALAQCAATQAFEPERTWREYERLAARCAPPAPAGGAADAAPRHAGALALATRRGLTYVALPGPRLVVYATFAAHAPVRAVGDRVAALARGLERASARLFAEPFLY